MASAAPHPEYALRAGIAMKALGDRLADLLDEPWSPARNRELHRLNHKAELLSDRLREVGHA